MRILLVAYEFPPAHSPRALRWRYLARELALLGHQVHVLMPDLGDSDVHFPAGPGAVQVHRVFPGPLAWALGRGARAGRRGPDGQSRSEATADIMASDGRLNWKGRLALRLKFLLGWVLFPDARSEWLPWARVALNRLLDELDPDVIVTSHEPASTLMLGRMAHARGFRWVADLGDPVCAPYTPNRWKRHALSLEASVVAEADHVIVTNAAAQSLLTARHSLDSRKCSVLTQGYDDRRDGCAEQANPDTRGDAPLEMLFCGRLYGFRNPDNLLRALETTPGVRLTLVLGDPPPIDLLEGCAARDRIRVTGKLPHEQVLDLQREADILLNIGNRAMPAQLPGKVFEYLGAGRPILHICPAGEEADDAATRLVLEGHRGWVSPDDPILIAALLSELVLLKLEGRLQTGLNLSPPAEYALSTLGVRLSNILGRIIAADGTPPAAIA